ncbi:MAG TPA: hypothetical protein V6D08_07255, partial [Candidatus Obscuribacterales bacterium]
MPDISYEQTTSAVDIFGTTSGEASSGLTAGDLLADPWTTGSDPYQLLPNLELFDSSQPNLPVDSNSTFATPNRVAPYLSADCSTSGRDARAPRSMHQEDQLCFSDIYSACQGTPHYTLD